MRPVPETRVIGVDPGVARMGYAVVERAGGRLRALCHGVLETPAGDPPGPRLASLRAGLEEVIAAHRPQAAALERLFFTTNVRTAMAVGQASGVALLAAAEAGLEVHEYTPKEVKQAVAGFGGAPKAQVQRMVAALLGLAGAPRPDDAADACAVAICHLNRAGLERALRGAR